MLKKEEKWLSGEEKMDSLAIKCINIYRKP